MKVRWKKNTIFIVIFILIISLALFIISTDSENLIYGFHLGDIGYAICIYLLCSIILNISNKSEKLSTLVISIVFMLVIELTQFLGLGTSLQTSQNTLLTFIGKYVIGSRFDLFELILYITTLILFDFIIKKLKLRT